MSSLAGKTLLSTYSSLLKLEGDTQTLVAGGGTAIQVKTGDNEVTPIYLNTDRVGIGTASPDNQLEISGTMKATSIVGGLLELEFASSTAVTSAVVDNNNLTGITINNTDSSSNVGAMLKFSSQDGIQVSAITHKRFTSTSSELGFHTMAGDTLAQRMVIDASGDVGIGPNISTIAPDSYYSIAKNLVIGGSAANAGITIAVHNDSSGEANIAFSDAADGTAEGRIEYKFISGTDSMTFIENGIRTMVLQNQRVGIGASPPNANAILDVASTTMAFMPPRMTTTQRDAVSSPTAGMVLYNTTTNVLNFYNGSSWGAV